MTMQMPHNPLGAVAREAMEMGDKHGGKAFQTMAMVSMGVMAFAGASQVLLELFKALNRQDHARHGHESRDHGPSWQEREHERRAEAGRLDR
jgi:hypothetical protein